MLYKILSLTRAALLMPFRFPERTDACEPTMIPDPLAHPDIQRMWLREIADLPLDLYSLPEPARARRNRRAAAMPSGNTVQAAKACICAVAPL